MLLEWLQAGARPVGREFLYFGDTVWSYGDFCRAVAAGRERLAKGGVTPGTVVAVCGPYCPETLVGLFAAAELKAIVVPLAELNKAARDQRFNAAGVEWSVETLTAGSRGEATPAPWTRKIKRANAVRHPLIEGLVKTGRPGLILFSSGTTGPPKAMLHDLHKLVGGYTIKRTSGPRTLAFMNHDHIGGLDILFRAMASGASLVIPKSRDPETVASLIEKHRIEVLPASPTFLNLFLLSGVVERRDLSSLKIIGYGSEPMPENLLRRLRKAFPDVRLQQKFGTSETNAIRMVSRSPDSLEMKIEDSRVGWKVVDGELWVKSPSRILGYLNVEGDSLTGDGWYRTGDLVDETGEGYFRIIGRRTDLINVGGEKVFPSEVENVLMAMPEVSECRAYGEDHSLTGKVVSVDIVPTQAMAAAELKRRVRAFCRGKMEPYKIPVKVYPKERLETGASFKKTRAGS